MKNEVLWNEWNNLKGSESGREEVLRKLRSQLGMPHGRPAFRRRMVRLGAVAASAAIIAASAVWIVTRRISVGDAAPRATVIATGHTQKRHAALEDGTQMWLNESSRAVYYHPREITVSGEAYFDVENVGGKEFTVTGGGISARVTGTRFNFRAYEGEDISQVSLYQGSLTVETPDTVVYLAAGYELSYDHPAQHTRVSEMSRTMPRWTRDIINFGDATVGEVLGSLEKIYGVQIDYTQLDGLADVVELKFEGGLGLEEVLFFLCEISGNIGYRMEGEKIIMYNK